MNAFVSESFRNGYWMSIIRHTESIQSIIDSISPEQFQTAITLAVESIQYLKSSTTSFSFKESLEKELAIHSKLLDSERANHTSTIDQLKQLHLSELDSLQKNQNRIHKELLQQISDLKTHLNTSNTAYTSLRSQFDSIQSSISSQYDHSLQSMVQQKEVQHTQEIERIQQTHISELERMQNSVKEQMNHCESHYSNSLARIESLYQVQTQQLRSQYEQSVGSSVKGKVGEQEFDTLVSEYTSWGPLINTSKQSHATDRSCTIRNCETLIEIKKYSNTVPTKEVEKFYRDMEQHQNVPYGMFISLHSDICGKKSNGFFQIAWTPRSQLLVFVNSFYSHTPEDILTFLDCCADIARDMYTLVQKSSDPSDISIQLQSRIEQGKIYIEKEIKRCSEFLCMIQNDKKHLTDVLQKQYTNYKYQIEQSKVALQSTLSILLDTCNSPSEESIGPVDEVPTLVPATEIPTFVSSPEVPTLVTATIQPKPKSRSSKKKDGQ